jgi:murein DD-endopeptidase MepM/ murein hydrolase activator NlpD
VKGLYVLMAALATLTVMCLCTVIVLYTAGALAASQIARVSIPVVGGWVGDRIEAWVMGEHEPDTIWNAPTFSDVGTPVPLPTGMVTPAPLPTRAPGESCAVPSGWPVEGRTTQGCHDGHTALDISVVTGTPVRSTMCGQVTFAGWSSVGYGWLVIVSNGVMSTYYAHNSEISVSVGQWVNDGDTLALSGSTGRSTGPHVHYEVRENDHVVCPDAFAGPGHG